MDQDMKVAICDDEKPIRDYIEKCVREVKPDACVLQYSDASDMVSASFDADILFLDIQMDMLHLFHTKFLRILFLLLGWYF